MRRRRPRECRSDHFVMGRDDCGDPPSTAAVRRFGDCRGESFRRWRERWLAHDQARENAARSVRCALSDPTFESNTRCPLTALGGL
jgi:hypothetical protein